jgi:hypothetical protein
LCLYIINSIIGWHTKLQWHFISISYLAHEEIVLFWSLCYMSQENNKLLFKALWQFMAKWSSSVKRELIPLHHLHTPPCVGLEIILHDVVWFSKFPCFMVYCLLCNQHSIFLFQHTNLEISYSDFGHFHSWGQWKNFGWSLHLSACTLVASTFIRLLLHTNFLLHCNYSFPRHC